MLEIKSEAMFFSKNEIEFLASCVVSELNRNYGDYSFTNKMNMLDRLNEQLVRFKNIMEN